MMIFDSSLLLLGPPCIYW